MKKKIVCPYLFYESPNRALKVKKIEAVTAGRRRVKLNFKISRIFIWQKTENQRPKSNQNNRPNQNQAQNRQSQQVKSNQPNQFNRGNVGQPQQGGSLTPNRQSPQKSLTPNRLPNQKSPNSLMPQRIKS